MKRRTKTSPTQAFKKLSRINPKGVRPKLKELTSFDFGHNAKPGAKDDEPDLLEEWLRTIGTAS